MKEFPEFRSPEFLREHVLSTMAFYDGRCVDASGGFYQFFKRDGTVYDPHTRHLVGTARFIVTHAWAARRFPDHTRAPAWRLAVEHGLRFLHDVHADPRSAGFRWLLRFDSGQVTVLDETQRAYGLAFVLLAHAQALLAGVNTAASGLEATFALLERRFWEPAHGLYADEATPEWHLSPYRGQNANMHACEALLAAYEATAEAAYLHRAATIAESLVQRLAAPHRGLIWEHYKADWTPDWDYHRGDTSDMFRPWGYQVGHLAEWSRLLLAIERLTPGLDDDNWMQHRARQLFAAGVEHGWDRAHHGLVYGFAPDNTVCDSHKYWWVQAEAIGAAAALADRTGEGGYWDWYDRVWEYAWDHFVDHQYGAWHRQLTADNRLIDDNKSPACKVDYHTMGACYEAMEALQRTPQPELSARHT